VFYYQDSCFYLLYNFAANIGDSWILSTDTSGGCDTSRVLVTDTGSMVVNNKNKRWIKLSTNEGAKFVLQGKFLEGVGNISGFTVNSLFPLQTICDTTIIIEYNYSAFNCFSRNDTLLMNPSGQDCEYYLTHAGMQELSKKSLLKVYPNPVYDQIIFDFSFTNSNRSKKLLLYNSIGELVNVLFIEPNALQYQLKVTTLSSGTYYYQIFEENGNSYSGEFVKQ